MLNKEKQKLTLASENDDAKISDVERTVEIENLIAEYECGVESKPEWCVWVNDNNGGAAVLYWIRPTPESELVARRIAKHLKTNGTLAEADKTEWNPNLRGDPIYGKRHEDGRAA